MGSYLTNSNKQLFTGAALKFFDTFKKSLVVHKEPLRTLIASPTAPFYGYESQNEEQNFTYTAVTGVYDCIINPSNPPNASSLGTPQNLLATTNLRIKVEKPCRDFIEDGRKNEKFEFLNNIYNLATFEGVQLFLGLTYYNYILDNQK